MVTFTDTEEIPNRKLHFLCCEILPLQGCNQEIFKVGEVSWNKGISTNLSFKAHEGNAPQRSISELFLLDTLKAAL